MERLRSIFFLIFLVSNLYFTSACNKDCTPPGFTENIIGNWSVVHRFGNATAGPETVHFHADGTLDDNDFIIIAPNGTSLAEKSWSATGAVLNVTATSFNESATGTLNLVRNECNFISLEVDRSNTFLEFTRQ